MGAFLPVQSVSMPIYGGLFAMDPTVVLQWPSIPIKHSEQTNWVRPKISRISSSFGLLDVLVVGLVAALVNVAGLVAGLVNVVGGCHAQGPKHHLNSETEVPSHQGMCFSRFVDLFGYKPTC